MMMLGRGLPVGLSVLAAGLCLVIMQEVSGSHHDAASAMPPRPAAVGQPRQAGTPEAADQHQVWLKEILTRPLFNPDRHPVEVGVRGLPRLSGIVAAGSQRVAIFAEPSNGRPILAQAGAHIGAYEVQAIGDEGVTMAGPEGTNVIRPAFAPAGPAAPSPRPGLLQPSLPQPGTLPPTNLKSNRPPPR